MNPGIESLPDNVHSLKEIILSLQEIHQEHKYHIELLQEQIRFLKAKLFGRKSEKLTEDNRQLQFFDEAEETLEALTQSENESIVPAHTRKKPGRHPIPEDLPRIPVVHDLSDEEKFCGCGTQMNRIGEKVSEKLDIIPAKMPACALPVCVRSRTGRHADRQVLRHIRYKYACKACEGLESTGASVKIAPLPPQLIPQGIATAGLIYILTSKFVDALPFYRLEKIFERIGGYKSFPSHF